jgi:hypothetical protein
MWQNIREIYFAPVPKKEVFRRTGLLVNAELALYYA